MQAQAQNIIGQSPALMEALDHLSTLAAIDRPVLVLGERGTGKELAAERLHFLSSRWSSTLIKVNCGAITESLLESELFGHEAGAFTGASKQHIGRFELADGGTLFLDELGTMSLRLQEKLLRLIEYGEFERVGGQKTISVDVRIIAATNANLPAMADRGEFRWDLLDRLTFDVVRLPPLRERPEDIEELASHFAIKMTAELGWALFPGFSEQAMTALAAHDWPGNVRELKNVVERSVYRWGESADPVDVVVINPFSGFEQDRQVAHSTSHSVATSHSTAPGTAQSSSTPVAAPERAAPPVSAAQSTAPVWPVDLRDHLEQTEREWLKQALEASSNSQKGAAELLSLSYDQIRSLVRKHGFSTRPARNNKPRK